MNWTFNFYSFVYFLFQIWCSFFSDSVTTFCEAGGGEGGGAASFSNNVSQAQGGQVITGTGGNGGQPGSAPQKGGDANQTYGSACEKVGGNAGYSGDAIRSTVSSGNVTLVNAGTIHGGQVYSTSVS